MYGVPLQMTPEDGGQGLLVILFYVLALGGDWNFLAWQG